MSYQHVPIQDRVDIDNLFSAYTYMLDDGDTEGVEQQMVVLLFLYIEILVVM